MTDYATCNKEKVFSLVLAGKTVKAIDFDDEALYEIRDMQVCDLAELYNKPNVIFVVKEPIKY